MDAGAPGTPPTHVKGRPVPPALAEAAPRQKKLRISHDDASALMRVAGLEPLTTYAGSHEYWECRCTTCGLIDTHKYALIKNRTDKGCRACHPPVWGPGRPGPEATEAAAVMEAAGLTPLVPYPGTNKPWPCICTVCHEEARPRHHTVAMRTAGRIGCAECCRRGPSLREPSGASARMEAAGFEPLDPWPGSAKPWRSRCKNCGETCEPKYSGVTNASGLGCRTCSQARQQRAGRLDPVDAVAEMRAIGLEPLTPFETVNTRWECQCVECGEVVFRRLASIRGGLSSGCKHLQRQRGEAISRAAELGYEPLEPFEGPTVPWRCRCVTCGRESPQTRSTFENNTSGIGCAFCSGTFADPRAAEAFMIARGLRPLVPYPGRQAMSWAYECLTCGHRGARTYRSVKVDGFGCPACAGRVTDPDEAAALMREHGYEPLVPFPGVTSRWLSRCMACGCEAKPTYSHIKAREPKRPKCAEHMSEEEMTARMIAAGFTPVAPYPGRAVDRWPSTCNLCDAHVSPTYSRVMAGGGGAGCCGGPFDLRRPGRSMAVYLVIHEGLNAAKVGIALAIDGRVKRVSEHRRHGWVEYRTWVGLGSLAHALEVERATLNDWREAGLGAYLSQAQMPQDGYTETVRLDRVDLSEVAALIQSRVDEPQDEPAQAVS